METLTVRPVEVHEHDTWDEFVASSPQGTLFHTSTWKRVIDQTYAPGRLVLLGAFDSHNLVGGCVALEREKFGQTTAVTPLVTPYVGFLLEPPLGEKLSDQLSYQSQTLTALSKFLMQNYQYINLVNGPHLEDMRPLLESGFRLTPRFTYSLNLKLPAEELWQRLDGSVRRQIKKAESQDDLEVSNLFDPEAAYALFRETFARHGGQCPVAYPVFLEIAEGEQLRDVREVFCAHQDGRLVSFIVLLKFQRTLYYALAATSAEALTTGVSSMLVWEIIKNFANQELNTLDFVGGNVPSIARFKEKFNPRLTMHFQAEYFGSAYMKLGKQLLGLIRK